MAKKVYTDSDEQCPNCGAELECVEITYPKWSEEDVADIDALYECPECEAQFDQFLKPRW